MRLPLVVEPELTSRYSELVRPQKALRGVLMSVDLVVASEGPLRRAQPDSGHCGVCGAPGRP